ncbi:MAG: ABC transporter permease [Deltaproteobacteria bacterium]|jgi:NitT/TauT family transport system permease protein|nr:ABC transporter permease [Deltaproteobacteria bacterium]
MADFGADIGQVGPSYGMGADFARGGGKSDGAVASVNQRVMSWYGIIAFLLLWQIAPYVGLADGSFIPPLSEIVKDAFRLILNGELFVHIASSSERVLVGLLLAIATAVPLAILLAGFFPRLTKFLNPLFILLGNINPFALFPLFILLFGVGEVAKLAIIFWSSLFPILNFSIYGVANVDPLLLKAARGMGADRKSIFWKVVIPAALPSIFTGFKMGSTTAFLFLIAAEMLSANSGLGYLVHNASLNNYIPRIYVGVLGIAILGMAFTVLINKTEKLILGYKEEAQVG